MDLVPGGGAVRLGGGKGQGDRGGSGREDVREEKKLEMAKEKGKKSLQELQGGLIQQIAGADERRAGCAAERLTRAVAELPGGGQQTVRASPVAALTTVQPRSTCYVAWAKINNKKRSHLMWRHTMCRFSTLS